MNEKPYHVLLWNNKQYCKTVVFSKLIGGLYYSVLEFYKLVNNSKVHLAAKIILKNQDNEGFVVLFLSRPSLQGPCDRSLKSEVPCGSGLNWR